LFIFYFYRGRIGRLWNFLECISLLLSPLSCIGEVKGLSLFSRVSNVVKSSVQFIRDIRQRKGHWRGIIRLKFIQQCVQITLRSSSRSFSSVFRTELSCHPFHLFLLILYPRAPRARVFPGSDSLLSEANFEANEIPWTNRNRFVSIVIWLIFVFISSRTDERSIKFPRRNAHTFRTA